MNQADSQRQYGRAFLWLVAIAVALTTQYYLLNLSAATSAKPESPLMEFPAAIVEPLDNLQTIYEQARALFRTLRPIQ